MLLNDGQLGCFEIPPPPLSASIRMSVISEKQCHRIRLDQSSHTMPFSSSGGIFGRYALTLPAYTDAPFTTRCSSA